MSAPFLPLGKVQIFSMESPNIIATGTITNPSGPLKLGGYTNVSGSSSYLLVSSEADGVHLTQPSQNNIVMETPMTITQPFSANGGISSTGNGTIGGDFAIAGATTLQTVAVAGAATFSTSVAVTGPITTQTVTVSGPSTLQGSATVGGALSVAGTAVFQQTLSCGPLTTTSANIQNGCTIGGTLSTSTLAVAGNTLLGSLSVTGASALNTLSTISSASFGSGVSVAGDTIVGGGLTVNGLSGIVLPTGGLTVSGTRLTATANTMALSVGGVTALSVDANQNLTLPTGGLITNSVSSSSGQALVVKGADAAGTVHIAGSLIVDGAFETANQVQMQIEDTVLLLAHSSTVPKPDSVADGAGLQIEGNSGFPKSITWQNNQGLGYLGNPGLPTSDGLSYFQIQGGNLVLTRTIPAANHASFNSLSGQWTPDSTATVVSYAFRIDDQENLEVAKTSGIDYSSPASNGAFHPVGQIAPVCATYEVSTS